MKIFLLTVIILLAGCGVNQFTASTKVSFKNGEWLYESTKNQQDLEAEIGTDANGRPIAKIKTTSSTPESAIAAALQSQSKMTDILGTLIQQGATKGAPFVTRP